MAKIDGYKERGSKYTPSTPTETKKEIATTKPQEGNSMSEFRKSMEDHMSDINSGRGNVPDNYKKKDK